MIQAGLRRCRLIQSQLRVVSRLHASQALNKPHEYNSAVADIRNVGIIAHIDAGKTTTTERMLFHAGYIQHAGGSSKYPPCVITPTEHLLDVDDGSTVTDYLPEERARGITITAAAITFPWAGRSLNLIDTPGHVDFTYEVARSLRVLDGAVAILDGVAGVEAQTEKVWRQADEWNISRIAFVNKMDREGAGFGRTVREISSRLNVRPVVLQLPVFEGGLDGGTFKGLVDLVDSVVLTWSRQADGKNLVSAIPLNLYPSESIRDEAKRANIALMDTLAELDDQFLELYLGNEAAQEMSSGSIRNTIRTLTIKRDIVPVFCGASLRDIGVQPLLDAIVNYLPSPTDRPLPLIRLENEDRETTLPHDGKELCALAFKVVHDATKGPLVFVRVYQGSLTRGMALYNTRTKDKERANRLLRMYADESIEIDTITDGNIGVILGLRSTVTGDTLINRRADHNFRLLPIPTPPPVFIASIEPDSLKEAHAVSDAIRRLLREDPSLSVTTDEDSGQILLGGMGELHLEISRDRLVRDFGAKCAMGNVRVGYRETVAGGLTSFVEKVYEREINGKLTKVGVTVEVSSSDNLQRLRQSQRNRRQFKEIGNVIDIDLSRTSAINGVDENQLFEGIRSGVRPVLQTGATFQLPLHSTLIQVSNLVVFENQTTYQSVVSAARLATQEAFKNAFAERDSVLMEPFMNVLVKVNGKDVGRVVSDLTSSRGGMILSMDSGSTSEDHLSSNPLPSFYAPPDSTFQEDSTRLDNTLATVTARMPLKEMVGYSKTLRSLTQGRGTFVMSLEGFERITEERAKAVRKELTGLEL